MSHFDTQKRSRGRDKGGKGSHVSTFSPQSTIGFYELHHSLASAGERCTDHIIIHELTESNDGLLATFRFAGHDLIVLMAGSRKCLKSMVERFEDDETDVSDKNDEERSAMEIEDDKINARYNNFEKNSFRVPKFWLAWKDIKETQFSGSGYIVFQTKDCAKFDGTISCEALEWKDAKIKGHKIKSHVPQCPYPWPKTP